MRALDDAPVIHPLVPRGPTALRAYQIQEVWCRLSVLVELAARYT